MSLERIAAIPLEEHDGAMIAAKRNRTAILVAASIAIAGCLALYLLMMAEGSRTWVVRHPSLEAYQRANPENILTSSEDWDPRLPVSSMIIDYPDGLIGPSMFRDFLACKPQSIMIHYRDGRPPQMPPRFYLKPSANDRSLANCVRAKLPAGYVIERSTGLEETLPPVRSAPTVEISAEVPLSEK